MFGNENFKMLFLDFTVMIYLSTTNYPHINVQYKNILVLVISMAIFSLTFYPYQQENLFYKLVYIITSIHPGIAPNIAFTLLVFNSKPFRAKIMSPGANNEN